jgi:hypothetical protein
MKVWDRDGNPVGEDLADVLYFEQWLGFLSSPRILQAMRRMPTREHLLRMRFQGGGVRRALSDPTRTQRPRAHVARRSWSLVCFTAVASVLVPACAGSSDDGDGSVEMAESSALLEHASIPVPRDRPPCGGIAGLACPDGYKCIMRNPPSCADCFGECVRARPPDCSHRHRPNAYVSRNPRSCQRIRFACRPDERIFFDDCGCGCDKAAH